LHLFAKVTVGILALIGAFYVGTIVWFTFFIDPCDWHALTAIPSPNREYNAQVELRSCEDDSHTELGVYVWRLDNPDVQHGARLSTNPATTEIYLEWRSPDTLVVRYPSALAIDNWPALLGDVRILFELTDDSR